MLVPDRVMADHALLISVELARVMQGSCGSSCGTFSIEVTSHSSRRDTVAAIRKPMPRRE